MDGGILCAEQNGVVGAPPLRQVSDANGNWQFFFAAQSPIHVAVFDPVSGLIAHSYFGSAASAGAA